MIATSIRSGLKELLRKVTKSIGKLLFMLFTFLGSIDELIVDKIIGEEEEEELDDLEKFQGCLDVIKG